MGTPSLDKINHSFSGAKRATYDHLSSLLLPFFSRVVIGMVVLNSALWLTAISLSRCIPVTEAARLFSRRSDLDAIPPINVSTAGWTVPLQGSQTCNSNGACTEATFHALVPQLYDYNL